MLSIRCPNCDDMEFLVLPAWEDFLGQIDLGKPVRIGLLCMKCQKEFLLQVILTECILGKGKC